MSEEYKYPTLGTAYPLTVYERQSFTVGAGQESLARRRGVTTLNVDFTDLALDIAFDTILSNPTWGSSSFNGLVFTSAAFDDITGVAIDPTSNFAGFDLSRVIIVGNEPGQTGTAWPTPAIRPSALISQQRRFQS